MIDDDIDTPEDFGPDDIQPEKPSFKEAWDNNPALKVGALVVGAAVLGGIYLVFFAGAQDVTKGAMHVGNTTTTKMTPGTKEVDPVYEKALQEVNQKTAEQAIKTGESAINVPIAIPKNEGLDIPQMPAKPKEDVLDEWRKVADAAKMKAVQEQIDEENAPPVPETVPMVHAIRPQPTAKEDPNAGKRLAEQMRVILAAQKPEPGQLATITHVESPYALQVKEAAAAKPPTGGTAGDPGAAGGPALAKTIVPAGTVSYGQLLNQLNSDIPGPALVHILSGPFAGGRLIGKITTVQEYMVITFTTLVKDAISYKVNAVALDEKTTLAGQATEVNRHLMSRVVLPAAAAFLTGYASSAAQVASDSTSTTTSTTTTADKPTAQENMYKGLEEASRQVSQVMNQFAQRPTTVVIAKGTTMGVFFTMPVTTKDAQ